MKKNISTELAPIKKQVSQVVSVAGLLQIRSKKDLVKATDILGKIKSIGYEIRERKDSITKPMNEALKNVRELFRPLESNNSEAETTVKMKMIIFNTKQLEIAKAKEESIVAKVESGDLSMEKGADKIEKITPEVKIESDSGSIQFRIVRDVEIINASLLPREYLVPDRVLIRKQALAGVNIPGVRVIEKQQVASSVNN